MVIGRRWRLIKRKKKGFYLLFLLIQKD